MSIPEPALATAAVGPFAVADATREQVVSLLADAAQDQAGPTSAFALHVGGLLARGHDAFVAAMNRADVVYADGASVVTLARAGGAQRIERSPTTDIGWDVLHLLKQRRGTPARVSILGGRPGVAQGALDALVAGGAAEPGVVEHGYHEDWSKPLARLAADPCDVLVVGLGAPLEMLWVDQHLAELRTSLVLTCGGWLGFLNGEEARAPGWMQRFGLEWVYRLVQSPRRLFGRYAKGALVTADLGSRALLSRLRGTPARGRR